MDLKESMESTLDNLNNFEKMAGELGIELTEFNKGVIHGHKQRVRLELKTLGVPA